MKITFHIGGAPFGPYDDIELLRLPRGVVRPEHHVSLEDGRAGKVADFEETAFLLDPNLRTVGIFGGDASGKTSYLASLLHGIHRETDVKILPEPETMKRFQDAWNRLKSGRVPDRTPTECFRDVAFSLKSTDLFREIRTRDYAGEIVRYDADPGCRRGAVPERVWRWIASCDALLVFLDATVDDDERNLARLKDIEILLRTLFSLGERGGEKPIGVVLTKWDAYRGDGKSFSSDYDVEKRRAEDFLYKHDVLRFLVDDLRSGNRHVDVFPASAYGEFHDGNLPPPKGPKPLFLGKPFLGVVETFDRVVVDRMLVRPENRVGLLSSLAELDAARDRCDRLETDYGIGAAILKTKIDVRRRRIRRLKRIRFLGYALMLFAVLLSGLLLVRPYFERFDRTRLNDVKMKIDRADSLPLVDQLVNPFVHSPFGALRSWKIDDLIRYAEARKERIGEETLEKRTVERFDGARRQLEKSVERHRGDYDAILDEYERFLREFPESTYPMKAEELRALERERQNVVSTRAGDIEAAWKAIGRFSETEYEETLRALNRFLGMKNPEKAHVDDAKKLREKTALAWDLAGYGTFHDAASKIRSDTDLIRAGDLGLRYRTDCKTRRNLDASSRYENEVAAWCDRFEEIKRTGCDLSLDLRSIEVSHLKVRERGIQLRLLIDGKNVFASDWIPRDAEQPKENVVRFTAIPPSFRRAYRAFWDPAMQTKIVLRVFVDDYGSNYRLTGLFNPKYETTAEASHFPWLHFAAPLELRNNAGNGDVRIVAELRGLGFPELPEP